MSDFAANRSRSDEARLRQIEDSLLTLARSVALVQESLGQTGAASDTTGGGSAAVAAAAGGGGGGGSPTSLLGDVTGPVGSNTVEKARGFPFPTPVAGDDEKFLSYEHATLDYVLQFVTLAGDVSGDNTASVVDKAKGIPLPSPVAADDEKALVYDHGTVAYVLRTFTTMTLLGAWTNADISALAVTDAEILNVFASDTLLSNVMPAAGFLEAIAVKLSGDVGAVGNDLVVTCYKNGVATALTVTVTGGAGTEDEARAVVTPIAFAALDDITVQAKKVGTPGAVRAAVQVFGRFAG